MKVGKRVLHEILTGGQSEHRENSGPQRLIAYWEKRERGVVFSRPLRALRAA